tara:strand:- start:11981 stop:12451 length:471 start_codon:yes stop_codon:yes gene_type:complete
MSRPDESGRKVLYLDMDGVLVDFMSGADRLSPATRKRYDGMFDKAPGVFGLMDPVPGAVEAFMELSELFDVFVLSTPPWGNSSGWSDKYDWVHRYLGDAAHKRLILTHRKDLSRGDYLVDDRMANGADRFEGELVRFGSDEFPDWRSVVDYLKTKA